MLNYGRTSLVYYIFHYYFSFAFFLTVCRLQMSQCASRSFRLVRFTSFRCCFQFVLSLSLATSALQSCFCFGRLRSRRVCLLLETRPRKTWVLPGLRSEMNRRWSTRFFQCSNNTQSLSQTKRLSSSSGNLSFTSNLLK